MPTTTLQANSGVAYVGSSQYTPSEAPGIGNNNTGQIWMAVYGFAAAGLPAGAIIQSIRVGFTTALSTSAKPWKISAADNAGYSAARNQVWADTISQVRNEYHEVYLDPAGINVAAPFFLFYEQNGSGNTYGEVYKWDHGTYKVTVYIEWIYGVSNPTVSPTTQSLGSAITISTNRQSSALTHTLKGSIGGYSWTIATSVGDSYTFTLPDSLANYIRTAKSGTLTITCETYANGSFTGSASVAMTVTVPARLGPTAALTLTGNKLLSGEYVQGVSTATGAASGTAQYGAGIASVVTTLAGQTYSTGSFTTPAITQAGTLTATTTVTDSRGYTATATRTITVQAYSPPQVTTLKAYRCDASGNALASGTYIRVDYTFTISSVNGKNSITTRRITWAGGTVNLANNSGYVVLSGASATLSYVLTLTVIDALNTVSRTTSVPQVQPVISVPPAGNGVGFGTEAVANALKSAWPILPAAGIEMADQKITSVISGKPTLTYNVASLYAAGAVTGAFVIDCGTTNDTFYARINLYDDNFAATIIIDGYLNTGSTQWAHPHARVIYSSNITTPPLTISFRYSGARRYIQIGSTTQAWSYAGIAVEHVMTVFGKQVPDWALSFTTSPPGTLQTSTTGT